MKSRNTVDTNAVIMVMTVGAVIAVLFYLALSAIARPNGFPGRMESLEAGIAHTEELFKAGEAPSTYPAGAVCAQGVDAQVPTLKARVQSAAQAAGVTLASVGAAPATAGQDGMTLNTVSLQFQANGRYDQMMSLLASLANSSPSIFVDTADLVSKTSSADLKFQGRVFCSASAHP